MNTSGECDKFPSFLEFLNEEDSKRGRGRPRGTFKWDPEDGKFIDDVWNSDSATPRTQMNAKIHAARQKLQKRIERANAIPASTKLSELYAQAQSLGLKDLASRLNAAKPKPQRSLSALNGVAKNWQKLEDDVRSGIQNLFDSGFFLITNKQAGKTREPLQGDQSFKAENAGGGLESDIRVSHGKKIFYVECKLDYESSGYFKYSLQLVGGKLHYDHKRYLQGKDPAERKRIDHLFKYKIRLDDLFDEILSDERVEKSALEFFKKLDLLTQDVQMSEEFKLFSKHIKLGSRYPEGFQQFAQVFDEYLKHYSTRYNQIVDQMFACLDSSLDVQKMKSDFKVDIQNANASMMFDDLLPDLLKMESDGARVFKNDNAEVRFCQLGSLLQSIEVKFEAILAALKKPSRSFASLFQLKQVEKLKYFFKAFISGTKDQRKKTDTNPSGYGMSPEAVDGVPEVDELGVMQICDKLELESTEIPKKIARFYVLKDKCAYIQIGDQVFGFDADMDPFGLEFIPSFEECMTKYEVKIHVSDALDDIRLQLRALEPQNVLGDKVSFVQSDPNYIAKVLDPIEIDTSDR